jgi:hypothetical protein
MGLTGVWLARAGSDTQPGRHGPGETWCPCGVGRETSIDGGRLTGLLTNLSPRPVNVVRPGRELRKGGCRGARGGIRAMATGLGKSPRRAG